MNEVNNRSNTLVIATLIWAAAYPGLLKLFSLALIQYNEAPSVPYIVAGAVIMLLMILLPVMAFHTVAGIKNTMFAAASSVRVLLFVMVASPPAYILVGTLTGLVGMGRWQAWVWLAGLLIGVLVARLGKSEKSATKPLLSYNLTKKIHRTSAVLLVFGFIGLHIINHAAALISSQKHEELRLLFRRWYEADLVEPVLFALLVLMALTGFLLAKRYMRSNVDIYRTLQLGSGIYMVFFLCAHVTAVLSARGRGVETDWIFATGEQGLINGYFFLIPYYILSVGMIWLHVSSGVRMILLEERR